MTNLEPQERLLKALLLLSQANDSIDIFSLSQEAELDLFVTLRELAYLDADGLVDARRLRLTIAGLACAVPLCPEARWIAEANVECALAVA